MRFQKTKISSHIWPCRVLPSHEIKYLRGITVQQTISESFYRVLLFCLTTWYTFMNIVVYLFDPKLPPTVEIKSNKFFVEWCKAKARKVTPANHIILGHWMNQSEFEAFYAGNACEQVTLASAFIAIW